MRRVVMIGLLGSLAFSGAAGAQDAPDTCTVTRESVKTWTIQINGRDYEAHPATPTYEGTTGLFFLPSAYTLPKGKVSVSLFRDNLDRDPKDVDVSIHGFSLGWGISNKLEFFGKVNFLKGALTYSDFITTVSRKYSQEVQTAEYGFGLEGVLRNRAASFAGILNGVDYEEWNPESDPFIAAHYSAGSLEGKQECRRDLLRRFGMDPESPLPVLGIVSRFAAQKGFDLIALASDHLAHEELTMCVLGSGDKIYEELFRRLVRQYPKRFAAKIGYDNELAHCIEAGSDMFLMPSRYEPCGLNQIYSLKYGTVPIVRAVGGLDDTIDPYDARTGKGTGFRFHEYTPEALLHAIRSALALYRKPKEWHKLMLNGMAKDFSWTVSAREYLKIYDKVRASRHAVPA